MIMSNDDSQQQREKDADTINNNKNKRTQRKRSVFDLEQIRQLEYVFNQITHYPDLPLRQQLTLLTDLPDKKVQVRSFFSPCPSSHPLSNQIWFQNRRAKWRKQHQLGHFGGLHELVLDGHSNIVPAPKSNFVSSTLFNV